jgi:DNA-binding transcriptional LysR family regulator
MLNLPTDLLRTLTAVIDLHSFTKAAHFLGVTQPAVSAQIKRLQALLGSDLLDKSVPGVALTPRGKVTVEQARRLLAVNDEIMELARGRQPRLTFRVGVPGDYAGAAILATLGRFRMRMPGVRFVVGTGSSDNLLRDIRQGDLDVALAVTVTAPAIPPRHGWMAQPVWVHSNATVIDPECPVPLISYGEDCACQRVTVAALRRAGREFESVFTSRSLNSLAAAVRAGFGVMVMPRGRALRNHIAVWTDAPLPMLPELHCGIFIREGANRAALEELADCLASDLRTEREALEREAAVVRIRPSVV